MKAPDVSGFVDTALSPFKTILSFFKEGLETIGSLSRFWWVIFSTLFVPMLVWSGIAFFERIIGSTRSGSIVADVIDINDNGKIELFEPSVAGFLGLPVWIFFAASTLTAVGLQKSRISITKGNTFKEMPETVQNWILGAFDGLLNVIPARRTRVGANVTRYTWVKNAKAISVWYYVIRVIRLPITILEKMKVPLPRRAQIGDSFFDVNVTAGSIISSNTDKKDETTAPTGGDRRRRPQ